MESQSLSALMRLLELRPSERSARDLQEIVAATANIKFFASISTDVHTACCKVMRLVEYPASAVVFNKGDPGDSFCIILSGSVNALIPPNATTPLAGLKPVAVLSMGQAFGELALLHNKDRAATIQTRENTLLAVLEKADFTRILHRIEEKRLRSKAEFLRSLRAFAEWSELRMERLVYFFQELTCSKGQIVYRQGDLPDNVYVTLSGEFQFRQDLAGSKSALLLRKNEGVLTVIGAKELFGEREALSGQKRQNTCVCSSQTASLYFIPKEDFIRFYQKESTQTCIQRVIDEKERWLHQRKSQLLKAEEVINAVNVQTSPEAKSTFQHSSASLSLKRDLQKFSNMIVLKGPIPVAAVGSAGGQKTSVSVGEMSSSALYTPKKSGKELLLASLRMSKTRKSVSFVRLQPLNSRRFSSILH